MTSTAVAGVHFCTQRADHREKFNKLLAQADKVRHIDKSMWSVGMHNFISSMNNNEMDHCGNMQLKNRVNDVLKPAQIQLQRH